MSQKLDSVQANQSRLQRELDETRREGNRGDRSPRSKSHSGSSIRGSRRDVQNDERQEHSNNSRSQGRGRRDKNRPPNPSERKNRGKAPANDDEEPADITSDDRREDALAVRQLASQKLQSEVLRVGESSKRPARDVIHVDDRGDSENHQRDLRDQLNSRRDNTVQTRVDEARLRRAGGTTPITPTTPSVPTPARVEHEGQEYELVPASLIAEMRQVIARVNNPDACSSVYTDQATEPFGEAVMDAQCPAPHYLPTLDKYDGTGDPHEHVEHVRSDFTLRPQPDAIMCRTLATTFTGAARRWFRQLPHHSIHSFAQLAAELTKRFIGSRVLPRPVTHLMTVRQGPQEALRDYLARFQNERAQVDRADPTFALAAAIAGLRYNTPMWQEVSKEGPKTWAAFDALSKKFINLEDAQRTANPSTFTRKNTSEDRPSRQQSGGSAEDRKRSSGFSPGPSDKRFREYTPKFDRYTPLTATIEQVYQATSGQKIYNRPRPLFAPPETRDKNQYCAYHADHGHTTANCRDLRDEIEALIRRGHLQDFKRTSNSGGKSKRRGKSRWRNHNAGADKQEAPQHQDADAVVQVISGGPCLGGTSKRAMKSYADEARHPPPQTQINSLRRADAEETQGGEHLFHRRGRRPRPSPPQRRPCYLGGCRE